MKKKISLTKGKSIFIIDLLLIPVFAFVIYSGLKLHVAGHSDNHDIWEHWAAYHVIISVLFLIFCGLHIKAHWGWYKNLAKKGLGKKSRITVVLSLLFLIEVVTGVILVLFIEGGSSSVGMWHYVLGLITILFVLLHILKRFSLMMKGIGYRKRSN